MMRNRGGRREPVSKRASVAPLLAFALSLVGSSAKADPSALWRIVHDSCLPHEEAGSGPKPCEMVDLAEGVFEGVAILKDLVGVAQMLAIPTRRIGGIEDPQMLQNDAPPVFAVGWKAKALVEARLGKALPRAWVALAINSQYARSQNQLHVHVDCVARDVVTALAAYRSALDDQWRAMTIALEGRKYLARRLISKDLSDRELLLRLLADDVPGAKEHMGAMSFAAIGADFDGKPGFVLLADTFSLEGGGHAEDIQDHNCEIARFSP